MKLRVVLAALLLFLLMRWFACEPRPGRSPARYLVNRMWVNKVAKDPREVVFHFGLFDRFKSKTGIVVNASAYRFAGDLVRYRLDGDRLTLVVPQDKTTATFKVRTWPCPEAPRPLDLCLELKHGGRKWMLYGARKSKLDAGALDAMPGPWGVGSEPPAEVAAGECADCVERLPTALEAIRSGSAD